MEIVGISEEFQLAESYQQYLAESGYDIDIVGVLPNSVDRLFLHYLYDILLETYDSKNIAECPLDSFRGGVESP